MRKVQADTPVPVLLTDDVILCLKLYTLVGYGRGVVPHIVCKEHVAWEIGLHQQLAGILIVIIQLEFQTIIQQLQVKTEVVLVALLPRQLLVRHRLWYQA